MFTALVGALGGSVIKSLVGGIIDGAGGAFEAYMKREITREELAAKVQTALLDSFKEVETAHSDALAKTYESFQATVRASPEIALMFKVVIYSQTFVLVWHQWFIPFYLHFIAADGQIEIIRHRETIADVMRTQVWPSHRPGTDGVQPGSRIAEVRA